SGCAGCSTIPDAYQSGVTQYSSPVIAEEDSTLSNDTSGVFHYMLPHQDVSIIPYDQGYYAEYQVSRFSEFWIDTRPATDIAMTALVSPGVPGACNLSGAETIRVKVKNNSSYALAGIPVSYSINGAVVNDTIPAIAASDSVIYAFAQTADLSGYQQYGLTAWVSYSGDNDHSNDSLPVVNFQTGPVISTFPYLEGFENGSGYWYTYGTNDSWQWGSPAKPHINKAANGSNCWVTSLTGNYNNNELSYLYSPCFDLSGLTSPVLSFSHIFRTQDNCDCDYHWVEYSTDGVTWTKLGAAGSGTNWYDNTANQAWQLSDTIWHVSSYDIPVRSTTTKFRIVMKSDASTTYEGIGIDDIHIFDKGPIYSGPDIVNGLTQSVSGNNWIDFSTAGTRVASINPNGQDLGNTTVKVFFNSGPVRNDGKQYYLDRNMVIRPTNTPTANVSVRFYFLDSEVDRLLKATGCNSCISLTDAYQAGVTQYSSPILTEENGLLTDDVTDTFHFLQPHKEVNIIPYDNGYYAAYQVSGFSEFWINSGSADQDQPNLVLLSFTAARAGKDALLQWSTIQESATSRYVIEKSRDSVNFYALDSVKAVGNGDTVDHYQYTDNTLWSGNNYYRLKIIASDGGFTRSPIRLVSDSDNGSVVAVYPNPVIRGGLLYITTASNCQNIRLMDVSGRSILSANAHGLFNTLPLTGIAKGIYLVGVYTDAGRKVVKIFVK
ncbi:MAG TPA: T9SS type A sorting domain-containing protein, partial [Puia sp.]|nr:T9SS type A sorting domain-containing protein [Puia sp.]